MKKSILTLCVIMLTAVSAFAGGGDKTTKYLTPSFKQGWFIDLAGTYSIMASTGSTYSQISTYYGGFNTNNPLAPKQHQFGFSAKAGRRVSPSVAIRVGYDRHKGSNIEGSDFRFKSLYFDVMESPLDLFFGYNPNRLYTMWVYGGMGLVAWDPSGPTTHKYNLLLHIWDGKNDIDLGFRGGIMNNFRLSNSLDFHIDLTAVATRWSFDTDIYDNNPTAHNAQGYARWHRAHFDFSGMVGLMWYLGGRELTPAAEAVEADCSEQEKTIAALNEEILRLRRLIENQPDSDGGDGGNINNNGGQETDTVVKVLDGKTLVTYPFSVFFNKSSYELRDGRDRVNLQAIAKVAKDNNLKLNLRGTCDSGTGTPAYNKTLAENRCNKIKAELKKLGIDEKNITIDAGGGVKELTPAEYDRRVVITLSK